MRKWINSDLEDGKMFYCWEIWCGDVFLGYEYSHDGNDAIAKSLSIGGVASQYSVGADQLIVRAA